MLFDFSQNEFEKFTSAWIVLDQEFVQGAPTATNTNHYG